jgi:hypothetical protein
MTAFIIAKVIRTKKSIATYVGREYMSYLLPQATKDAQTAKFVFRGANEFYDPVRMSLGADLPHWLTMAQ